MNRAGVLDVAASTDAFPEALRLLDLLVRTVERESGSVSATTSTTISLDNEVIEVRMREGSERRRKEVGKYGYPENECVPTKQLWLSVTGEHGSRLKTLVGNQEEIDTFVHKVRHHAARLPKLRKHRAEKERAREEEQERWRAKWRSDEERRRQWREQQERFDKVFADAEKWAEAERIRAYAAAFEARHIATNGPVAVGGHVDGWLRWLDRYATHVDGPDLGPEDTSDEDDDS